MLTVNMHEAKSRLSELVRKAEAGELVILARDGKPAARLVPVAGSPARRLGVWSNAAREQPVGWDEKIPPGAINTALEAPELENLCDARVYACGFGFLDITPEHCQAYGELPRYQDHRDPFDRMLAVQAKLDGRRLMSRDRKLERYGAQRIW